MNERQANLAEAKKELADANAAGDTVAIAVATSKVENIEAAIKSAQDAPAGGMGFAALAGKAKSGGGGGGFAAAAAAAAAASEKEDTFDGTPSADMPEYSDTDSD